MTMPVMRENFFLSAEKLYVWFTLTGIKRGEGGNKVFHGDAAPVFS